MRLPCRFAASKPFSSFDNNFFGAFAYGHPPTQFNRAPVPDLNQTPRRGDSCPAASGTGGEHGSAPHPV
jgi:hypothetical protein